MSSRNLTVGHQVSLLITVKTDLMLCISCFSRALRTSPYTLTLHGRLCKNYQHLMTYNNSLIVLALWITESGKTQI